MKMYPLMKMYSHWHVLKEICHKIKYLTHIKFISSANLKVKKIKCVGDCLGVRVRILVLGLTVFYKLSSLMHYLSTVED